MGNDTGGGESSPTDTATSTSGGTTTGSPGGGDLTSVRINVPPSGYWTVAMKHMQNEGVLAENLNAVGYKPEVQYSWDGSPLFAAGKQDIVHVSPLEAARLGPKQDMNVTMVGRIASLFEGFWVRSGSKYDPANVEGGPQEMVDKLAEDNAVVVIGSWAGGDIPGAKVAMNRFGYEFSKDSSPFRVITASYSAIPRLLANGKADMGLTSPGDSGPWARDGKIAPIIQFPPWFSENVGYVPPLVNVATGTDFVKKHPEGVKAYVETWHEGMSWLMENGAGVVDSKEIASLLAMQTIPAAKYVMKWALHKDVKYKIAEKYPIIYKDTFLSEDYIDRQKSFLNAVGERNLIPDGWKDHVSFKNMNSI